MNLGKDELKFYELVYSKLNDHGQFLDERNCIKLIERGIDDPDVCKKIWTIIAGNGDKQLLTKQDFFKMLKLISAHQQGYKIDEVKLETLPELPRPNLPKKTAKEISKSTVSLGKSTSPAESQQSLSKQNSISKSEINGKISNEKENTSENHELTSSPYLIDTSNTNQNPNPIQKEVEKTEESKVIENKSADFKPVIQDLDDDLTIPTKWKYEEVPVKNEPTHISENQTKDSKSQAEGLDADLVVPTNSKHEEIPEKKEIITAKEDKTTDIRHSKEDLDTEVILTGKVEQVEIPAFDESVRFTNPSALKNPFKLNTSELLVSGGNRLPPVYEDSHRVMENYNNEEKDNYEEIVKTGQSNKYLDISKAKPFTPHNYGNTLRYNDYLEQRQRIQIEIIDTMTHKSGFLGSGTYISYFIKCKYSEQEVYDAERRYSDFDWLNSYLRSQPKYKGLVFPKLPEKKSIGTTDPNFVHQRRVELEKYLKEIAQHEVLSQDPELRVFLGDESKDNFQDLKERNPQSGLALKELDWHKMKEAYEYAFASVKIKLRKEDLVFDWNDTNDKINEVLRLDSIIGKTLKDLQKKDESYKVIRSNLNIVYTKVMNRVEKEEYFAIGALSNLFVAEVGHAYNEAIIIENLIKEVKVFRAKLDGFKESYALLIATLHEILTNKELFKNKNVKMLEYQAENSSTHIDAANKDICDIEKKIGSLQKEAEIIRDNLSHEMDRLFEEFEVFIPDILNEFYAKQGEHLEKSVESWRTIQQQQQE